MAVNLQKEQQMRRVFTSFLCTNVFGNNNDIPFETLASLNSL